MKLYILCDKEVLNRKNLSLESCIDRATELKASIIQYRNKLGTSDEVERDLNSIRAMWNETLIVNDYIDMVDYVDGLHIGQEDLLLYGKTPVESVKNIRDRIGSGAILGLSTHNREEIKVANSLDLNYIGLGAYRSTSTKSEAGLLQEDPDILAEESKHPIGLIGGVKLTDRFQNIEYLVIGSGIYE
jgi:thiamine-phosphate pyrophosphorylase